MTHADNQDEACQGANILIIDDDEGMAYTLGRMVQEEGHRSCAVHNLREGLALATSGEYAVVFLDVRLPDGSGIDIIPQIQATPAAPEIIIITAYGDRGGAQTALKNGVWDYIEKPARLNALKLSLKRALQYRTQKRSLETPLTIQRTGIIGSSSKLLMCITLMGHAARSDASVLIGGETGTGKELFARAIHANSQRAGGPFVVVDCAALPENLIESILFGHVRGAFTGAERDTVGLIKKADNGTLFMDEVGELPLALQKTFLRVLQERKFRPVGAREEVPSNFRLVSATNRDLQEDVKSGRFRQDLLFRLRTFVIEIPALRERKNDIKEIAHFHVERLSQRAGIKKREISQEFLEALELHDWPGNVRELISTLESALALEPFFPTLLPKHLPEYIRTQAIIRRPPTKPTVDGFARGGGSPILLPAWKQYRQNAVENAEQAYINKLVQVCQGDMEKACQLSKLKRARLYQLMKKYGIARSFSSQGENWVTHRR
jgi:two-component system NtrC family response regulator